MAPTSDQQEEHHHSAHPEYEHSRPIEHEPSLTDSEIRKIRDLLQSDSRARWLWETARVWAVWISAVVFGFTIGIDTLKKALSALISK